MCITRCSYLLLFWFFCISSNFFDVHVLTGKTYDLGGQVLAANSAPVVFHLAKELGCELEAMDSHKFALIDASTGKYQDMEVADDYLSVISLTLTLQVSFKLKN